ncbi:Core-2/I-branching beta-1-6-N-acetylglucosaminyltransferase family protein [Striga hermonthica]|uniref:Core-2/I-branching beta-1-6-N-acetylglucosaminyltransferase family protein n=1 Tax=Striga hermonthica TaxID=68872 RepID=A0A9N7MN95_STRHE|nr:Core-2/I-branching beta-1-6-N-acetylglucosaminyltransferase family protein [Striga hermonthica]
MAAISTSPLIPTLILLLSLPILFFLVGPRILPSRQISISAPDELDDLSLFHKAIAMDSANFSRRSRLPSARSHLSAGLRRPKVAFLFLTNSPLHFAPLWERFFSNVTSKHYNIYIHADPYVKIPPFEGVFKGKTIPAKRTQRSSPTLISAARRLLATAMLDDPSNAYFALISQHCIPLHSFNYLYNFLFDLGRLSKNLEFSSYIEILDNERTLWDRYNARGKDVMLPEVNFEEFRVGSQFFVLTRKHALMVIKDRKLWRKFKLPCLNVESCYPEEHYFPTMLSMQDPNGCSHYTLTRVNWTDSVNGHPHTYHPPEVSPELIYKLRESNSSYSYMFARKFSPDCLAPLMGMADEVIFKD